MLFELDAYHLVLLYCPHSCCLFSSSKKEIRNENILRAFWEMGIWDPIYLFLVQIPGPYLAS
uniref:Uncharacterized protein n=1 Tax=Arundo donax TaxID=35708 RepID=A0A0A9T6Q7_ARUDO